MKKLNIAVIMQSPDLGGAETHMVSLLLQFKSLGHKVTLATNRGKYLDYGAQELNSKIYKLPFILDIMGNLRGLIKTFFLLPFAVVFYLDLLLKLKKSGTDLILLSSFTEKLLVTLLSVFVGIPVFWIEYGPLEIVFRRNFHIPKFSYIAVSRLARKIIVPSMNTYKSLVKDARVSTSRIEIIPCGVVIRKVNKSKPLHLRNKIVIGSVSRLTREKGQDLLIKSFPHVLKRIPNAQLVLVGDGPDKEYYEKLVRDLTLSKNISFEGFVEDVSKYYEMFDVFVFPTVWDLEGFGLVIVEAMSYSIPVIGSSQGPVPEIIDDNRTGIIVDPRNKEELANAIIKLVLDKSLNEKMGDNGYKKVAATYDLSKIAKKILGVIADEVN